jgi:hypothetical protein
MMMTNKEILSSYNHAADKKEQIKILSELNACDEERIKKILTANGVPETDFAGKRRGRPKAKSDVEEIKEAPMEKQEIPFADGFAESNGAITGGEGDVEGYMDDTTRIKKIPDVVRELCRAELEALRREIAEIERKRDAIADFLNGESV